MNLPAALPHIVGAKLPLLSACQYIRLVKEWVALIGPEPVAYGIHSPRRTKVSILYRKTGNLRACRLLLGHTKLESTARSYPLR